VAEPELSFAGLLRQLRAEARLTQEELAEAATLSPEAVSALERGIHRTAHKDTAVLLASALGLPEQVCIVFVAAARSCRSSPAKLSFGSATAQHPPRDRPPRLPGAAREPDLAPRVCGPGHPPLSLRPVQARRGELG